MKTSKKILALVLSLCMIFSLTAVVSAEEAAPAEVATIKYVTTFDELWDQWDANGEMKTKASVVLSNAQLTINLDDEVDAKALYAHGAQVSFDFVIPGENPITLQVSKATLRGYTAENGTNSIWFTSVLPFDGEVAQQLLADAETDETLRSILYIEDANEEEGIAGGVIMKNDNTNKPVINGEVAAYSYTEYSKLNLVKYLGYKAGGVENALQSYHNADVDVTINTPKTKDYKIPHGSFFISQKKIQTFSFSWATENTHWTWSNNIMNSMKDGGTNLDLAYGVFEAPATGEYDVFALKRDRAEKVGSNSNRDLHVLINGEEFYYPCDNSPVAASASPAYNWESENGGRADRAQKTVKLVKGQKFVMRVPGTNRRYAGCLGYAFVPASANMDAATMIANKASLPATTDQLYNDTESITIPGYTDADKVTVNVTVNGVAVAAVEDAANDLFPNIALVDKAGNFIEGATVLDAVATADEADTTYALTAAAWDATNTKLIDGNVVNGDFTSQYITTLNGAYCVDMDQIELKEGDEIVVKARDVMKVAITANGGAAASYGDVVATNGANCKFNMSNGNKFVHIVADSTVQDAYAGYYVVGYAPVIADIAETTGDDTLSWNRIDYPILSSGYKSDGTTFQFGYNKSYSNVTIDGKVYGRGLSSGQVQASRYDMSHLYVVKNALPEKATVTAVETANGVILYTDAPVSLNLVRVTKDGGAIKSTKTENVVLNFMDGGKFISVDPGETLYLWKGLEITAGTSAIPVCAPISK
ncbi:MAG: hypothetical protein IJE10_11575 [Clostridia bacterium]|nr:hypothetical protein [Clostridia bacterium]